MKKQRNCEISRRGFLKGGGATLSVAAIGGLPIREVIALARASGKKVLTEANLNNLIASVETQADKRDALATEFRKDFMAFLQNYFALTPQQIRELHGFAGKHRPEINRAVERALQKKYAIRVVGRRTGGGGTYGAPNAAGRDIGSPETEVSIEEKPDTHARSAARPNINVSNNVSIQGSITININNP